MSNNIYLTGKCNLKCKYCFASEYFDKVEQEITLENFIKALAFIKKDSSHIGLIGGEPTIHSQFNEITNILLNDNDVNKIYLYTNGLNLYKYETLNNHKFNILINCNPEEEIGENNFENLRNSIKHLREIKSSKISLGVNINEHIDDYSYIFELLEIIDLDIVRVSYAISNIEKENSTNILDSFIKIKPIIISFYKQCLKHNVIPNLDCNSIPYCILDSNDRKIIMKILELSKSKYTHKKINIFPNSCTPVLDIFPNLTVGRCFGLSKYIKVHIENFSKMSDIEKYFIKEIDEYAKSVFIDKKCKDCKYRLIDKCNICMSYKIKDILSFKNNCINCNKK